jgi:chemotaxis protein methyltransferase CheR
LKDAECIEFLQWALPQLGLRWPGFRKVRRQVCKRISRRMTCLGLSSPSAYGEHLLNNAEEWAELDSMCRITISRFYRDENVFQVLSDTVLPLLAERAQSEGRRVQVWCAGSASGEEVYTLKIIWDVLLHPSYPTVDFAVLGTDIDDAVLSRAEKGCYENRTLREMPPKLIDESFERCGNLLCVRSKYRRGIIFSKQDVRRTMPAGPFDLILCRYLAFTYFNASEQRRMLASFAARLRPNGYLVIGRREVIPEGNDAFQPIPECKHILKRLD